MPCYNPFDDGSHEYSVNSVGIGKYAYIYYGQDLFGKPGLRNYTGKRVSGVFGLEGLDEMYNALEPMGDGHTFGWESGLNNGLTRAQNQILQNHREAHPKTVVTDAMQRELEKHYDSPKYLRYILPQWTIVRILAEGGSLNRGQSFLGEDIDAEYAPIVTAEAVQVIDYDSVNFGDLTPDQQIIDRVTGDRLVPNVGDILTRVGAVYTGGVPLLFIRCPVRSGVSQLDNAAVAAVRRCIKAHKQRLNYIREGVSAVAGLAAAREAIFGRDKIGSEDYPRPWENYWGDGWFDINYADGDQSDDNTEYQPTHIWDHLDETRRLEVCGEQDICSQYTNADTCNAHFKPVDHDKPDEINCMWCNNSCRQYDEGYMSNCSNLKNTASDIYCGKKSGVFGTDLDCDTTDADGYCSSDMNSGSIACTTGYDSNLEHCPIGTTIDGRSYMYYDAKPPDNVGDWRGPGCNVRQCRNCKDFDGLTTIYCGEDSCTAGVTQEDKDNLTSNCAGANDNDLMTCPCGFQHDDFNNYAGKSCDIRKCTKNKFAKNRIYCGKDVCSADESVPSSNAIGSDDTYLIDCPYGYTHKGFQGSFGFNRRICDKNH